MAIEGLKPVFAVYSTFLQRAYDQVLHDVCIQRLPIIFAIDRAGIVGEDGETHQGVFDLSYLSHMPNLVILAPKCVEELRFMLRWAVKQEYPIAIRYPKGGDNPRVALSPLKNFIKGKWEVLCLEGSVAIIATGKMVQQAILAQEKLRSLGISVSVINACFIKPIDKSLIDNLVKKGFKIVTIEDNMIHGGLGSMILEYISSITDKISILNLGFKDEFIPHGNIDLLYKLHGLDVKWNSSKNSKIFLMKI